MGRGHSVREPVRHGPDRAATSSCRCAIGASEDGPGPEPTGPGARARACSWRTYRRPRPAVIFCAREARRRSPPGEGTRLRRRGARRSRQMRAWWGNHVMPIRTPVDAVRASGRGAAGPAVDGLSLSRWRVRGNARAIPREGSGTSTLRVSMTCLGRGGQWGNTLIAYLGLVRRTGRILPDAHDAPSGACCPRCCLNSVGGVTRSELLGPTLRS
jgi:hypothetical protein